MPTQVLVGAYPLLLHPRGPEGLEVAVVGWGSGVTVGTALQFPLAHLDAIELERATLEGSKFFSSVNHLDYPLRDFPWVQHPKLSVLNNDGRNFLSSTDRRYDVVISEPSNPWITGVSNLFTADHFRAVSQALKPDGLFVQWVQLYEMSPDNIKSIYATIASVFPYIRVFAADAYSSDTILVGSYRPIELDPAKLDHHLREPGLRRLLEPAHASTGAELLARLLFASKEELQRYAQLEERRENGRWSPSRNAIGQFDCEPATCRRRPAPINTDDNALIEFAAPRDLIGFDAHAGYLDVLFDAAWPYGQVEKVLSIPGDHREAAKTIAMLSRALLNAGRPERAVAYLKESVERVGAPVPSEFLHAVLLANTIADLPVALQRVVEQSLPQRNAAELIRDPGIRPEGVEPSSELSEQGQTRVRELYARVERARASDAIRTALAEFSNIPAGIREHSGPSLRLIYGYLLYRIGVADPSSARFGDAAEELEGLAKDFPDFAERHPEVLLYAGRARYLGAEYASALKVLTRYVDFVLYPPRIHSGADLVPEPGEATDSAASPTSDEAGEALKDLRNAATPVAH